jgi:hypothetical protein
MGKKRHRTDPVIPPQHEADDTDKAAAVADDDEERPWKKVDVGISAGDDDDENDSTNARDNHYDNEKLAREAARDLEALPKEHVAMFFGLEVIQGDEYTVEEINGAKKIRIKQNHKQVMDAPATVAKVNAKEQRLVKETKLPPAAIVREDSIERKVNENKLATFSQIVKKPNAKNSIKDSQKEDRSSDIEADIDLPTESSKDSNEKVLSMQSSWMAQTGVVLHEALCESLLKQDFWTPTPIQAAVLPAAIMGRRNIVGAAPTGSGKTLAFLLPICQFLLDHNEKRKDKSRSVQALIVAPTRELALQIHSECEKLMPRKAAVIVGGLAQVKQTRVLKYRPPIVIGTPGRLWELVRCLCVAFCR